MLNRVLGITFVYLVMLVFTLSVRAEDTILLTAGNLVAMQKSLRQAYKDRRDWLGKKTNVAGTFAAPRCSADPSIEDLASYMKDLCNQENEDLPSNVVYVPDEKTKVVFRILEVGGICFYEVNGGCVTALFEEAVAYN